MIEATDEKLAARMSKWQRFWTAAGSEAPRRFGDEENDAKAVSPLRFATAVQIIDACVRTSKDSSP